MSIEIIYPADKGAWLAARNLDVTASVAAALLGDGVHPYVSCYQLWAEKSGRASRPETDEQNEAMERGELLEPVVVEMVRRRFPDWTVTYRNDRAYYRDAAIRIGATPDAFVEIPGVVGTGNLQIKTAWERSFREQWFDPDTQEVTPPLWICTQAIVEAKLTGCTFTKVALLLITWQGTLKLYVLDVPLHDRLWTRLKASVGEFWKLVESGEEPDPDWSRDVAAVIDVHRETLPFRKDLTGDHEIDLECDVFLTEGQAARAAHERRDRARAGILQRLGTAEAAFTSRWNISASVNQRGVRALRIQPMEQFNGSF